MEFATGMDQAVGNKTCMSVGEDSTAPSLQSCYTLATWQGSMTVVIIVYDAIALCFRSSHYGSSGSGFNKLCLPLNPSNSTDWRQSDADNSGSRLYGVQYVTDTSVYDLHDVNGKAVPCAVCEASNGPVVTITGMRQACPRYSIYILVFLSFTCTDSYSRNLSVSG